MDLGRAAGSYHFLEYTLRASQFLTRRPLSRAEIPCGGPKVARRQLSTIKGLKRPLLILCRRSPGSCSAKRQNFGVWFRSCSYPTPGNGTLTCGASTATGPRSRHAPVLDVSPVEVRPAMAGFGAIVIGKPPASSRRQPQSTFGTAPSFGLINDSPARGGAARWWRPMHRRLLGQCASRGGRVQRSEMPAGCRMHPTDDRPRSRA